MKANKPTKANRSYLINNLENQPTASQTSRTASLAKAARLGTGCQGILVPAVRKYADCRSKEKGAGQVPEKIKNFV